MSNRKIKGYGWKPDSPDHRDRSYNAEEWIYRRAHLPRNVDLRSSQPPVWDQGQLGSCVSHGVAAVLVSESLKQGEQLPGLSNSNAGYSRLFIYYQGRVLEGTVEQDSGLEVRDGIKAAVAGTPPETDWPYDINRFLDKPPDVAFTDAPAHKALVYRRVMPWSFGAPVLTALANDLPVVFGFSVPAYFEGGSWDPARTPLPIPSMTDNFIGGHCVVLVGYDRIRKTLIVRNSWGAGWGDSGYFEMDERWTDPREGLSSDFWVVSSME